jgi:hypothetical protein
MEDAPRTERPVLAHVIGSLRPHRGIMPVIEDQITAIRRHNA